MTAFTLKLIALLSMLIDHIGVAFELPIGFRIVGRLAFPIFVFLIAEGFHHTRSPEKFLLRLFIFAIISEPFYDWAISRPGTPPWHVDFLAYTNIFYTLFLGGMAIFAYKKLHPEFGTMLAAIPALIAAVLALMLTSDYGAYGVFFIVAMYLVNKKWRLPVLAVFCLLQFASWYRVLLHYFFTYNQVLWGHWLMIFATLITVPLIAHYNGQRGRSLKWLFYAAYPAHLAILGIFVQM